MERHPLRRSLLSLLQCSKPSRLPQMDLFLESPADPCLSIALN